MWNTKVDLELRRLERDLNCIGKHDGKVTLTGPCIMLAGNL